VDNVNTTNMPHSTSRLEFITRCLTVTVPEEPAFQCIKSCNVASLLLIRVASLLPTVANQATRLYSQGIYRAPHALLRLGINRQSCF
jgi:hypothetical protein